MDFALTDNFDNFIRSDNLLDKFIDSFLLKDEFLSYLPYLKNILLFK